MRIFFFVIVLSLVGTPARSQEYMGALAQQACDCLIALPENLDQETFNMKLGLCMLEKAQPYQKELKRDHGIDLDKIDVEGEKLGRIIGIKMVGYCPDAVLKMSKRSQEDASASAALTASGQIVKIEDDQFVVLHLKEKNGKTGRFYWITFVESAIAIEEYKQLQGQAVSISYSVEEFFDPKTKEYRYYNLISKIEAD
jgi:hypothetical protein